MRTLKLSLLLILAVALAIIALQNQAPFQIRFLWLMGEVPGIILLFLTATAGFIMGVAAALLARRGGSGQRWTEGTDHTLHK